MRGSPLGTCVRVLILGALDEDSSPEVLARNLGIRGPKPLTLQGGQLCSHSLLTATERLQCAGHALAAALPAPSTCEARAGPAPCSRRARLGLCLSPPWPQPLPRREGGAADGAAGCGSDFNLWKARPLSARPAPGPAPRCSLSTGKGRHSVRLAGEGGRGLNATACQASHCTSCPQ